MAAYWTDVAPALPHGAAWSEPVNTNTADTNLFFYYATCRIARLNRTQVVVKADIYTMRRKDYAYTVNVGMDGRDPDNNAYFSDQYTTRELPAGYYILAKTLYFICDAAPGQSLRVRVYLNSGAYKNFVTFTAPAYLLPEIKAKVNGEVVNISEVYVNVGGVAVPVDSIKFNGG